MSSRSCSFTVVYRNLLKSLSVTTILLNLNLLFLNATYIHSWIVKLSSPCFKMTRWAFKADIFLLSPQRIPGTWQRHQISKNRLLLSSIPLLHPSIWCAQCVHWNTRGKQIYITVIRFKPPCSSVITPRLTFTGFKHPEELWELLTWLRRAVPVGYRDKEETLDYSVRLGSWH